MKYYAVIDTNVLVSAMLRWDSVPGCVLEHAFVGDIIPLLNEQVLKEYMEVLKRPGQILTDPKDIVFYEIVMEKRKHDEAFLVTGNIKHFPTEPYIVTPREMLTILESE